MLSYRLRFHENCHSLSFRLPGVGGVYPPGFAFAETTLVDRLNKHDVTFESSVIEA